ncbi:MAG: hypothetical protein OIN85_05880 [Candidatus Methanoperedens sp.]|nr:hypothetical protein [Candidatus Methanoperedens sp.]
MNMKKAVIILLLTSIILAGIPESFARPEYLTNLTAVYGSGSCGTCHVTNSGSGMRDFNGTIPANGTYRGRNRTQSPNPNGTYAGRNPNRTIANRPSNRTLNSYGTLFENQPDHATDPKAALMAIGQPPLATATPDVTSAVTATGTKAAPGFDLVVFVFGTSAGILLARRHKK